SVRKCGVVLAPTGRDELGEGTEPLARRGARALGDEPRDVAVRADAEAGDRERLGPLAKAARRQEGERERAGVDAACPLARGRPLDEGEIEQVRGGREVGRERLTRLPVDDHRLESINAEAAADGHHVTRAYRRLGRAAGAVLLDRAGRGR